MANANLAGFMRKFKALYMPMIMKSAEYSY